MQKLLALFDTLTSRESVGRVGTTAEKIKQNKEEPKTLITITLNNWQL